MEIKNSIKIINFKLKIVVFFSLLLMYGLLLVIPMDLPNSDDMARHIINGREILHGHWQVLYYNVYSYTMPEQRFINHHWLSGVIFYILKSAIGWKGLSFFKIILSLSTFALLFKLALKKANFWLVAVFSLPAIIILAERGSLRPELFSYFFVVLFLYVLFDFEEHPEDNRIYWLIPLQILWVNIHIFFILGPVLVGGVILERLIKLKVGNSRPPADDQEKNIIKKLTTILGILSLACLLNPNGIDGALVPFSIFRNYGIDVSENNPVLFLFRLYPFWSNFSALIIFPSATIFFISFILYFRSKPLNIYKNLSIFYFLGVTATAVGSFFILRLLPFFAIMFLPAVTMYLNSQKDWLFKKWIGRILIVLFLLFCASIYISEFKYFRRDFGFGLGLTAHADDAGDFLKNNGIQGPIFNDYDSGSYLIYKLYPQERVFVDNRPEAFTEDFFKNTYTPIFSDEGVWPNILADNNFNAIFIYRYDHGPNVINFVFRRIADPEWSLVFADSDAIIFLRNDEENRQAIEKFKITQSNVVDRMKYLHNSGNYIDMAAAADNYGLVGRFDLAMQTYFDIVSRWPEIGKVWMVMGELEMNNRNPGSPALALMYLDKAISVGYNTAEAYSWLGKAYLKLGKYDKAREAISKALQINPERTNDREALKDLDNR